MTNNISVVMNANLKVSMIGDHCIIANVAAVA